MRRYAALAVFFGLPTAFLVGFDAVFFAAHRWRILSAAASRWAAENFRRFFFGAVIAWASTDAALCPESPVAVRQGAVGSLKSFDCFVQSVTLCHEESDYVSGFHSTSKFNM